MHSNPKAQHIKELIASQIGVEADDINTDDMLSDDLHMSPADLSDLTESLNKAGFDINQSDFSTIETVEELIDHVLEGDIVNG